jgi:hypothetical protein
MQRSKCWWCALALFVMLLVGSSSSAGAQEADDASFTVPPYSPTEVYVALIVDDITTVNEREGFVEMSGTLIIDWEWDIENCVPEEPSVYQGEQAREELKTRWWPEFVLRDGIGPRETKSVSLVVVCGFATIEERFQATVSQDFENLNDFPFDDHELSFTVMSSAQDNSAVRIIEDYSEFVVQPEDEQNESLFQWASPEWNFNDFETSLVDNGEQFEFFFPETTFPVQIDREPWFHISNIVLPLILIVSISWVVFWGNRGRMTLAERLGISITCLLTVVAFDFLTGDSLPRLAYTTRLDAFDNVSYLFVAFTVVLSVISVGPTTDGRGRPTVRTTPTLPTRTPCWHRRESTESPGGRFRLATSWPWGSRCPGCSARALKGSARVLRGSDPQTGPAVAPRP